MEDSLSSTSGYFYCTHCKEYVSESTLRRHKNLFKGSLKRLSSRVQVESSSESEDDVATSPPQDFTDDTQSCGGPKITESLPYDTDESIIDSDIDTISNNSSDESADLQEEIWDDAPDFIQQDLDNPPPLPEPKKKKKKYETAQSLVHWMLYFLLLWQSLSHLSDNGLTWLLQFFLQFLKVLNVEVSNELLTEVIKLFPCSLYMVRKFLALDRDNFTKYVVCPKCTKCYHYDECLTEVNGKMTAKLCGSTHYSRGKKVTCNSQLVRKVILKDKSIKFYPLFYYCYNGIINSLEMLLQKEGFPEKCEEWRSRGEMDCMADVYDGKLWHDFRKFKGKDFLNAPRNYGLMLNFDYFQPMKHRKDYSVGVLYLVVLNLPRAERFKWENVIVIGIIPSMGQESKCLNEFLKQAVAELKALWRGVHLQSSLARVPLKFRAALLCTSSDIPASRKLCGLKGHSAELGCSKCLKNFQGNFGEKRDYSGFQRDLWEKRTNKDHRVIAEKIQKCKTKAEAKDLAKKFGINFYSLLLDLEYFDVIRFCAIDPMHNLFLGTAKYVFKFWITEGYLSKQQLRRLEARIEQMDVPQNIGRLPQKISSNYGSYTAEQWKNWTLLYSLFALKGIMDDKHLKCWQTFSLACRYICSPILNDADLIRADGLLLKFCKEFQSLYGKKAITPNMHLHCHLREVIKDYGPIHSFWCFSFERYNGILGKVVSNNRSIELQLMRKLTTSRFLYNSSLPSDFSSSFENIISNLQESSKNDVNKLCQPFSPLLQYYKVSPSMPLSNIDWSNFSALKLPSKYAQSCFDEDAVVMLCSVYEKLLPDKEILPRHLSMSIKKYGTVNIYGVEFGSKQEYRSKRSTGIIASWPQDDGDISDSFRLTFGTVDYYFTHSIALNGEYKEYIFACITWYVPSSDTIFADLNPLVVTSKKTLPVGPSQFLPIQKIHSKCSYAVFKKESGEERYIISPFVRHFSC